MLKNKQELIRYVRRNSDVEFLFFWGHKPSSHGVHKSCLSQWYPSIFSVDNVTYVTAEHFMMAEKAKLFGDQVSQQMILESESPAKAKRLGRRVEGFNRNLWDKHKFDIVVRGNLAKFTQSAELRKFLVDTEERILVEASPNDDVWGIGLAEDHRLSRFPTKWPGENLLGFALMSVRELISKGFTEQGAGSDGRGF